MTPDNGSYVGSGGEVVRAGNASRQAEHLPSDNQGYVDVRPPDVGIREHILPLATGVHVRAANGHGGAA